MRLPTQSRNSDSAAAPSICGFASTTTDSVDVMAVASSRDSSTRARRQPASSAGSSGRATSSGILALTSDTRGGGSAEVYRVCQRDSAAAAVAHDTRAGLSAVAARRPVAQAVGHLAEALLHGGQPYPGPLEFQAEDAQPQRNGDDSGPRQHQH